MNTWARQLLRFYRPEPVVSGTPPIPVVSVTIVLVSVELFIMVSVVTGVVSSLPVVESGVSQAIIDAEATSAKKNRRFIKFNFNYSYLGSNLLPTSITVIEELLLRLFLNK